ncbi:MAG: restriction endonuclease [Geobacteraceae bacterium]|nr:restriction endonuclease [Geobacteraceae bacterium]
MAVPDFQSFFKPILDIAADNQEHSVKDARTIITSVMNLSVDDLTEKLPSGTQFKFDNRIAWAISYFVQAKVLERPRRAYFKITDRGRELHQQNHSRINIAILKAYPEFLEFQTPRTAHHTPPAETDALVTATPDEILQQAYQSMRNDLASEILEKIKNNSPGYFENLVVDLLVTMGYGGSRADAGQSLGRSGDEGIDGIIKEDRLGLDVIYLQAKRWDSTVGRPEIQRFVGALHGKRAKKGVFITTGRFSNDAVDYVATIDPKVILIDGRALVEYMIDFNLGVTTATTYEIKRIDSDYFSEE